MPLDPMLLEILACPEDKGPLFYLGDENSLYNPRLRRVYHIAVSYTHLTLPTIYSV